MAPLDRCAFGQHFDRLTVECPAFQPRPFVAATSYGKPLGTHVACAHLLTGEIEHNQFYPRCALGSEHERVLWVAAVGPGRFEVSRALQAEFAGAYGDFHRRLIDAKAAVLAAPPGGAARARAALAATVREFLLAFDSFVGTHAARVEELGIDPAAVTAEAARVLQQWQRSRRLEFPQTDSTWMGRPGAESAQGDEVARTPQLVITRSKEPPVITVTGQVDGMNLDLLELALNEASPTEARSLDVDVAGVTFCSVAGLRILARAAESGTVRLVGATPHLRRASGAAGFGAIFEAPEERP
ncbi:MAG: STAS domain-containing protein [Candidatus Dormiibacterota bacterium]